MDDDTLADFVRRRAGDCCEYCRLPQPFSSTRFQIDHIIAEQHGGCSILGVRSGPATFAGKVLSSLAARPLDERPLRFWPSTYPTG